MTKGKNFAKIDFVLVRLPKLKKRLVLLLSFVFIFAAILFACDPIKLRDVPAYNATVYGNGGSAVVKGDYIFFANAYIDMSTLTNNDNKYDAGSKQTLYAIYRAKLDEGEPKHVEMLTFNVGGYAYSGLYICGEYLYYTTPYTQQDAGGQAKTGLMRFERVRLDGTGREVVHSVATYDSNSDYDIVYIDGSTYICFVDSAKKLSVIECRGGNTLKHINVASDVTGMKLYEQNDIAYNEATADAYKYVYYTTKDSSNIYRLCRRTLKGAEESDILDSSTDEITLVTVKNNRVYYVKGGILTSKGFGLADLTKTYSSISVNTASSATQNTITNYIVLDDDSEGIVGVYYDGATYSLKAFKNSNTSAVDLGIQSSSAITILATIDSDIYYQISGDNALYKTSLSFPNFVPTASEPVTVAPNFVMSGDNAKSKLDFDHYRFYVYESNNSSTEKYLTMYMVSGAPYLDESDNIVGQHIGKLAD